MRIRAHRPLALAGALLLAACTQKPFAIFATSDAVDRLAAECRECPEDRALARATRTPEQLAFVRRVNAIEYALTRRPLLGGNSVELLRDGPATHRAQLAAIRAAKRHVHLVTYILSDDKVSHAYRDALVERARAGVKVRFMWDSIGGRTISDEFRQSLVDGGVEVNEFGPLAPTEDEDVSVSRRHHRKILVVDGRVAFTGGINITDEKRASSGGSSKAAGWRDTHVRIEGPGVAQFQQMFIEGWEHGNARLPRSPDLFPELEPVGGHWVRAIQQQGNDLTDIALEPLQDLIEEASKTSRPDQAIYGSYLAAFMNAQSRIWIAQAYFMPNRELMRVLTDAAKRGVDVRLLVPSISDIGMTLHASRFHYAPLLEAGARIFEFRQPVMHSKTAVVDGVWATVGSSNLDYRSFIHNDEANAIVVGADFGEAMERMFLDDMKQSQEITREQWQRRGWIDRLKQRSAVLFKYWI